MIPKTLCALKGIMDNESMEKQKVNGTKSLKGQNIAKLPWSLCANTLAQFTNVVHSSHCPFNRVKKWKNMFDCHNVNGKKNRFNHFHICAIFLSYFLKICEMCLSYLWNMIFVFLKYFFHICEIFLSYFLGESQSPSIFTIWPVSALDLPFQQNIFYIKDSKEQSENETMHDL